MTGFPLSRGWQAVIDSKTTLDSRFHGDDRLAKQVGPEQETKQKVQILKIS